MFEDSNEALAEVQAAAAPYRAYTVEILLATAAALVLSVTVYLTFFDGSGAF